MAKTPEALEPQKSSISAMSRRLPFAPRTRSPLVQSQILNIPAVPPVKEKSPKPIVFNPFDPDFPKIFKASLERAMVGIRAQDHRNREACRKRKILEHNARVNKKSVKTPVNRFLRSTLSPSNRIHTAPEKRLRSLHLSLNMEPVVMPKRPPPRKHSKVHGNHGPVPIPMFPPRISANEQHHIHRWLFHRMTVSQPPLQSNVFRPTPFNPPRPSTFYEDPSHGRHIPSMIFGWFCRMNYDEFINKFPPLSKPVDPQWRDRIHGKDLIFFDCPRPPLDKYNIHILEIEPLTMRRMLGNRVSGWPPTNLLVPNKLYFLWMVHKRIVRAPNDGDVSRLRRFCRRAHRWDMYILDPTLRPYPQCLETEVVERTSWRDLIPACDPSSDFEQSVKDTLSTAESMYDIGMKRPHEPEEGEDEDEDDSKRAKTE